MYFPHVIPSMSIAFPVSTVRAKPGGVSTLDPVHLLEAKEHLRVTHDSEDIYIEDLITSAREAIEEEYGIAMITQEITEVFRGPAASLELSVGPVQTVATVDRADDNGDSSDAWVTADLLVVDRRVTILDGDLVANGADSTTVVYTAGYGEADDVPRRIKQAILAYVDDLYSHRGTFFVGSVTSRSLPGAVRSLLIGLKRWGV